LQFIKSQLTRPDSIMYRIQKINTGFGSDRGVFAPAASGTNQLFITSTEKDSVAAGMNPYHNRLFIANYSGDSLQIADRISFESVDSSMNQGTASLSADGNVLYFTQWKRESGISTASIYYSKKTANGWSTPTALTSVNQPAHNSKQPFCSADGKYLFFSSDRTGGLGKFDIWYAPLQADGTTGTPVNAGAMLNTKENEQSPFYHDATKTLVFASDRTPGMGGYDLYSSKGAVTEWKAAENMGYPVNSSRDDVYFFTSGKENLLTNALFSSDRGSECCLATYTVTKAPKDKMITGLVRDCASNEVMPEATVIMKDATGRTLEATTDADGKYSFQLAGEGLRQVVINKEKYKEKTADVVAETVNENNWRTDTIYNAAVCIDKKLVIKVENVITLHFEFNSSMLRDKEIAQLDSIYNILMEDTAATIQISGYTDGLGTVDYNKVLSDKRAKACADYLIQRGIDASKISFESFGSCCPVEMELINGRDNPDGRSLNRRALVNISRSNQE
jgi:OOP family OmpA-OmpF porin